PFLAVYCPCKEGHFNRSELEVIEAHITSVLSEHQRVMWSPPCGAAAARRPTPPFRAVPARRRNQLVNGTLPDSGEVSPKWGNSVHFGALTRKIQFGSFSQGNHCFCMETLHFCGIR